MSIKQTIKEKVQHFVALQERGTHANAVTVKNLPENDCLNCGTHYHGNYCPKCGQNAHTKRFTLKDSLEQFLGAFFHFELGISHTLVDLLYRPGYMIRDYLKGYRAEYANPIPLLVMLCVIMGFTNLLLGDLADKTAADKFIDAFAKITFSHDGKSYFEHITHLLQHTAVMPVVGSLLMAIPYWLAFRHTKIGKQTNIIETFYLCIYLECLQVVIYFITLPYQLGYILLWADKGTTVETENEEIMLLFTILIVMQFYRVKWWKSILLVLLGLFYVTILMGLIVIAIIIAAGTLPAN